MNRAIHCESGSSFMGLTVNAGLAEHSKFQVLFIRKYLTRESAEKIIHALSQVD